MRGKPVHKTTGFTLLELLVVATLSISLSVIAAEYWRYFSRQLTDLTARVKTAQELRFAVESITADMGATVGAVPIGANRVLLCTDGGETPDGLPQWGEPDNLVEYSLVDGQLLRHDQSSGVEIPIAGNVSDFAIENVTESLLQMTISVQSGSLARQVTLLWSKP